ncbi:glycosyltransferase family 8 protein (plasmid) [Paracoccus liaowanqingii]|uniref:Glycosyltransferase family 8 protein n=1 Tax=Paracoccus liaowanqingii TaxID=2560053 RepID=A0A4Y5SS99_9RHOB|nr:glycosyltransferase family 8 protein [Paracoccus liaowanqingii]QDA35813.1 glycosyltransferase family 8 protein [Paracoccus liaowanqingii]
MTIDMADAAVDAVQVLFCADRHYLQHAAVAAVSLAVASSPHPVHIHVMTTEDDPVSREMLAETLRPFSNVAVSFHKVDSGRVMGAHVDRYITKEAYLRFLAPEVLATTIRRVIYLDCDLVVLDDLRRLWEIDLAGCAAGAVAECDWMGGTTENRLTRLGIAADHVYVNSGVLVMDLDRWRRDRLADRLLRFAEAQGPMLQFHDQDALNAVLQGEIALLDRRWNVQALMFSRWMRKARPEDHRATRAACRNPAIIHFTTANKPWKFRVWTRKRALYYRYLQRTAWGRTAPPLQGLARLEHWLSRAFLPIGLDPYVILPIWQRIRRRL